MQRRRVLVTGGVGSSAVISRGTGRAGLLGPWIRLMPPRIASSDAGELLGLREPESCMLATVGIDDVYALAANMAGE